MVPEFDSYFCHACLYGKDKRPLYFAIMESRKTIISKYPWRPDLLSAWFFCSCFVLFCFWPFPDLGICVTMYKFCHIGVSPVLLIFLQLTLFTF